MRARALNALQRSAEGIGIGVVFASALAAGIVLHTNTPGFRRIAGGVANAVLADRFQGKIVIEQVDRLSLGKTGHVRAAEVRIVDAEGHDAIVAKDVEVAIDLTLLFERHPIVEIDSAKIGHAEVLLDREADGTVAIARAFAPKVVAAAPVSPKTQAAPPSSASPVVHVRTIAIADSHLRGNLVPPALEGRVVDLAGRFALENDRAAITLDGADLTLDQPRSPNQIAPLVGHASGTLAIDLKTMELDGSAALTGSCGQVPVVAHASIKGSDVAVSVDVTTVSPEQLATAFSGLPLRKAASLHAQARGKLPSLTIDARAEIGPSTIRANGEIDTSETKTFRLDVDAAHLDADAVGAGLATDLSAKAHAEGTLAGGTNATFRVDTSEGSVGPEKIPPMTIEGRASDRLVTAVVRTSERGVEASGKVVLDLPGRAATFDVQARSYDLRTLARAPGAASGAASARVQGKVDLDKRTVQATANVSGDGVAAAGFGAAHLSASGTLSGPIAAPELDVGFAGVDVAVKAPGKTPLTYPTATGHAKIALGSSPRVMDAAITVAPPKGDGEGFTASAAAIRVENGVVEARGLRVTGVGEPLELDARVGGGTWAIRAKSPRVDLRRAAGVMGIKELEILPEGTNAAVDVDIHQGRTGADGHIDIVVRSEKGLVGSGAVVVEAHATIDNGKLVGTGKLTAEGITQIEITNAELQLPPGRFDARTLERATGVVEVRGSIDLSQGAAVFGGGSIERAAGIASFEARIERFDAKAPPSVRGTVRTDGLELVLTDESAHSTTIAGIDLQTHVAWDGRSDDTELAFLTWDRGGLLGSGQAKTRLPLVSWIKGTSKIDVDAVSMLELDAIVDVPRREIGSLPPVLGAFAGEFRGEIDGTVTVGGSIGHPRAVVNANAHGIRPSSAPSTPARSLLDAALQARWDGEQAVVSLAVDQVPAARPDSPPRPDSPLPGGPRRSTPPGHVRGLVLVSDVKVRDLLQGKPLTSLPWQASGEIEADGLRLGSIPHSPIRGTLSGRARVQDLNRDPRFEVKAHVDNFGAGGARVQSVDVAAGGRDASAYLQGAIVDKTTGNVSQVTVQVATGSLRIQGVGVAWDPTAPTRVDYIVQNGNLGLLAPLLTSVASELDGRVDGTGSVTVQGDSQVFEGGLAIHDAILYANVIGEEVTGLAATARFDKTGTFRIDDASGKLASGEFHASANGRMKGFQFEGGKMTLVATKSVPVSAQGAVFAEATGEVTIDAKMSADRKQLIATVELPRANVGLPDRSTQALQQLDADPTIAVGVRHKNGELDTSLVRASRGGAAKATTAAPADTLTAQLSVTLGNEVHLTGRGLDVTLTGRTLVEIAQEVRVSGRIDLRGGTIQVQGRRFTIDHGTVTFLENVDPTNPTIVAAAYWDAPDRTRVWANYQGDLKSKKPPLKLTSEPPYSQSEILSILVFGRPDPNVAPGSDSAGSGSATAVGGGFVAGDLNRLLSSIDENLDVETDTLSDNRTRAKLGRSFLDRRLKVQLGYAPGTTYREPDTTYLFLNWQFIPQWSLLVTRGDKGTSIMDVLFQHRY